MLFLDGRSGSGKTTLAAQLSQELGWPVVHLDDFYPGWDGLVAASQMLANEVLPNRRFQRWNWEDDCPGQWETVPAGPLIIEGAGCWTTEVAQWVKDIPHVSVVLEAPEELRQQRALARDPYYAPYWQRWARQEKVHFQNQPPAHLYCNEHSDAVAEVLALVTRRGLHASPSTHL